MELLQDLGEKCRAWSSQHEHNEEVSYLKEEIKKKDEEITKLLEVQRKYTIELHKKNEEIKRSSQKKDNELHEKLQEIKQLNSLVIQKDEEIKLKNDQIRKLSDSKREMEERSAHELHMKDEEKNKEIKRCIKEKDEEIQRLNSLLEGNAKQSNQKLEAHEDICNDFYKYYNWIEFKLPRKLKEMDKPEIWKMFCNIYQISFLQCREAIHGVFMESLVTFTELSDEEEQTGKIRQEEVEHMTAAYQYLLQYCGPKMKEVDLNFIVEKVITLSKVNDRIPKDLLREQTLKAVNICWRMQTVSPPMFLCQPKLFNEHWHTVHSRTWYDKENELVYYRPVLMYSAGGIVAHKGFVGNKPPVEQIAGVNVTQATVKKEKVTQCPSCNKEVDACTNLQLTGGFCDNCYHIITTCNKCSKQLTPTDTHWSGGKVWHKDCLPVKNCSKYQCNKEPAELKDMIPVRDGKFYCHKECYTCSACGSNDVYRVSKDGQTIWCTPCFRQLSRSCCYCPTIFQQGISVSYPGLLGKLVCEECSNKIRHMTCFTCGKIIEKTDLAETNTGIYHTSCSKYATCNKCNQYLTSTDKHWYMEKWWHQTCLPVLYSCSKYCCNKKPAELEHMIQLSNFYYHRDECFTCSHCKHNEIAQVSINGKTLWCKSCLERLSNHCFYCQKLFQTGMKRFAPSTLSGKIICEFCYNKLRDLRCFTCDVKIEDKKDIVETSTGIHHSSCLICRCRYSIRRGDGLCDMCKKPFIKMEETNM